MAARRRKRRRRSTRPSISILTQQDVIDLAIGGAGLASASAFTNQDFATVANVSGETINRKVLRVSGDLMFSANLPAGKAALCMFALWAHPVLDGWPSVAQFDPWASDPSKSGFEGRPSPRPYGRRIMALASPASGTSETIQQAHTYRTKAERLLRPGWKLSCGLWVRADSGVQVRVFGGLRAAVAG